MIDGTIIQHIFIIGDPSTEPERIQYLAKYFQNLQLDSHVSYFQPTYKNKITAEDIQKYIPVNFSNIHNRPLKNSEISIFLNFIFLLEKIIKEYSDGYFAVFESDVIFEGDLKKYLSCLSEFISDINPDALSIGSGCDCIDDNVNIDDLNFQIFPKTLVRCMDSYIFSYEGIQKFLLYFYEFLKNQKSINEPIDNFFQTFLKLDTKKENFQQLWVWPSITIQGSQYNYYKSSIQDDTF